MAEEEWLRMNEEHQRAEIDHLRRANRRWKFTAFALSLFLAIVSLVSIHYLGEAKMRTDEAWEQLSVEGNRAPEVSLMRFQEIKLGMSIEEVEAVFGFRGRPGMGTEDVIGFTWRRNGNYALVDFGMNDGKVKCGDFILADGKQYWLERER
jgi:hypothetical protein